MRNAHLRLFCVLLAFAAFPAAAQVVPSTIEPTQEDDGSPLPTTRDKGRCLVPKANITEADGRAACRKELLPRQPRPVLSTPGAFFVGYAWGTKSSQLIYGPQVGVSGAIEFPLRRPYLERLPNEGDNMVFRPPRSMSLTIDLAVSLNANFGAFTFPNGGEAVASKPTQQSVNIGAYIAPQVGGSWWGEDGRAYRVALALGVMAGYINTEATGDALAVGFQPALLAQF